MADWELCKNGEKPFKIEPYELGEVLSGVAARVLGLSRVDFLELLAKYNVSVLEGYDTEDLTRKIHRKTIKIDIKHY